MFICILLYMCFISCALCNIHCTVAQFFMHPVFCSVCYLRCIWREGLECTANESLRDWFVVHSSRDLSGAKSDPSSSFAALHQPRRRRKPGEKIQEMKKTTWEKKRINPGEGGKWKEALLGWQIQGDCGREDTPMQAGFILASLHKTVLCNKVLLQKASLQFDSRKAGRLGANCAIVCLWTICTIHVCNASLIWSICATESSSVKLNNAESALQMHCNRKLGFWLRLKKVKSAF